MKVSSDRLFARGPWLTGDCGALNLTDDWLSLLCTGTISSFATIGANGGTRDRGLACPIGGVIGGGEAPQVGCSALMCSGSGGGGSRPPDPVSCCASVLWIMANLRCSDSTCPCGQNTCRSAARCGSASNIALSGSRSPSSRRTRGGCRLALSPGVGVQIVHLECTR